MYKGSVFYLRQHSNLFSSLSLLDNILIGSKISDAECQQEVAFLRESLPDLVPALRRRPSEASTGQRQMAACAQALMRRPMLLVLDEPSAGLSPRVISSTYSFFERCLSKESAVIFTEQYQDHARKWATRVVEISRIES
jgi:branched-chain amino acid transport system ATP-binding protein